MVGQLTLRGSVGWRLSRMDQLDGHRDRCQHAALTGNATAGDVECRAMVDRCAHDGQSDADVDPFVEGQQLHRNVPLIVIHRYHNVPGAAKRTQEHGIRRLWIGNVPAAGARQRHCWRNLARFVITE